MHWGCFDPFLPPIPQALKLSVRPVLAIVGGSNVFKKIALVERMVDRHTVDRIIIGGIVGPDFLPCNQPDGTRTEDERKSGWEIGCRLSVATSPNAGLNARVAVPG